MTKRMLIYGIGTFFSKIIVFFMVPIYARVFSQSDFGYYDVLISDMQMIVSIAFVEIWSGIIRFMFDDKDKYKPIKTMLRMMPLLVVFYAIGVLILGFFFNLKYPIIIVVYGLLYFLFSVSNSICRGLEKNTKYVISGIISTFSACSLSIIFTVGMHLGIEYLLISQCVGYLLAIVYVEITTKAYRNAIHTQYQHGSMKEMSLYCVPLMLNSFSYLFLNTFNKNIIIEQLGESLSGVYAYVGKFSAVVAVLLSVYALAWQEQAFASASADNREQQYSHYLNEFVKLVGLGIPVYTIVCIVFSPLFGGSNYFHSEKYIPLSILSSYISNFSGVISTVIAVKKKTNFIFFSTAIGAAVNVLIASLTIRNYGINAAAISLCISFGITTALRFFFAKKDFELVIQWKYLLLIFIEMGIILGTLYTIGSKIYLNLGIGLIMVALWIMINLNSIRSLLKVLIKRFRREI